MKTLKIVLEGLTLTAELMEEKAPKVCQAIWGALPLEGQVTNTTWSGEMLRLWVEIPEPAEQENATVLQQPGDILFVPEWNGLCFVYGPAQMRGPKGPHPVPAVGRLRGDLAGFVKTARRVEWDGAKQMRLTRGEA